MVADNIQKGIITQIYLKNFVTYDEVIVKPGKNLNLIIGANGTGKSTIVSAIVLGLAGNPKVIGRAEHVGEYVKAGEKSAIIKIDLLNDNNKSVTITRSFDIQNKTSWMVNDKTVTFKQISDLMKNFNIQVDNLCQFLPQDKVQEFSNMSRQQLLTETERSIGEPELLHNHEKLIQFRKKQVELEKDLERYARLLTKDKQVFDSLKDSVRHIDEQKQIKKTLKTLKQKKAWLLYQNKLDEFKTAKTGRDKAKEKRNKIEKKLKPIENEITKLKSSIQNFEKAAKEKNAENSAKTARLSTFLEEIEKCERLIGEIEAKCDREIKDEQECDKRIEQLKQKKDKMENDLKHLINNVGTVENLQEQFNATASIMNQHKQVFNELKAQEFAYKQKIDRLERRIRGEKENFQSVQNIENKRLEVLQRLSHDAYKGVMWLRANQNLFSKTVHEPMILKINLRDASYSKYFEYIIPQRDLTAFVCEDKNDMNLLIRYLRDQQKLKVNAVHSDPNKNVNNHPIIPLDHIRQYGFEHYLVTLIDAPRTILNYIIHLYKINEIPIGNDRVSSNLDQIPDRIRRFFSNNNFYNVSKSKYTGEKSTRQSTISSRGILSITVDTEKLNSIQQQLTTMNEERNELVRESSTFEEKFSNINEKIEAIKETRSKLHGNMEKIKELKFNINVNDGSIQKHQTGRKSIDEIRTLYKKEIQRQISEQLKYYCKYNKILDENYKNIIVSEEMKLQMKLMKNNLAMKENETQDLRDEFSVAQRNYEMLENELTPLKVELKNLFDQAKESTGGLSYDDEEFTPIRNAFARLPPTVEQIFEEIQATQAKIFCFANDQQDTERILQQYNNAKKNLDTVKQKMDEAEQELTKLTEDMTKIKDIWLPVLEILVEKINNNFSSYFTKMKCAGEVCLSIGENPMDFDKYGLKIRVKFRDADDLQELTRNHQSGGERAVTTAAYMIALQELTKVPFRCVDEINQGMDATNERRVFELIVDITSKMTRSQYFLLTPKLLPDLKYDESVTVLTVFNGKFMLPSTEFDIHEKFNSIIDAVTRRQNMVH